MPWFAAIAPKSAPTARPDLRKSISLTPPLSSTPENVTRIVVNAANSAPLSSSQTAYFAKQQPGTSPAPSAGQTPPLLTQNSAPSVLHRQRVVIKPDPSLLRFDSSESDNEEGHSQFPGSSSRKNSRETPKSRPVVHRRPPKRVQFGTQDEDEPDDFERQQPRQLMSRYTIQQTIS